MKLIKTTASILGSVLTAATTAVAVKNALEVKTDEEVGHKQGFYEKYVKRPQDFFCASAATIALSPVLAGTALLVKMKLGSPVLFTQDRPGRNGEVFRLYKFRTMTNEVDKDGRVLSDEERITSLGKMLRSTSLDELPELLNIIAGDMAVVGPRPLLVDYLPYYTASESHRHDVRPGLTGLAQVEGRNFLTWEEIFDLDLKYVSSCTFRTDFSILIKTIIKVLKRGDIADVETITVDEEGTIWVMAGDEKRPLHKPLNEEREKDGIRDRKQLLD